MLFGHLALLLSLEPTVGAAQSATAAKSDGDEQIVIRFNVPEGGFVGRRTVLEFSLSRTLRPDDGEIAMLVGGTDVTDLLDRDGTTIRYRPRLAPLPSGERDVVVYRRFDGEWTELQRFPLKVLTTHGLVRASVEPTAALGTDGQLATGRSFDGPAPDRPTFQDVTLTSGLRSAHQGTAWMVESQGNLAGASRREQALRFAQRGGEAPRVDLSDYVVTVTGPRTRLSMGHVSIGNHRLLANAFTSRGLIVANALGLTTLTVGAVSGTSVVGWDNLVGLDRPQHRILSAALTRELIPQRAGALRASVSLLDGSLAPEQSFTQGAVVDAERSSGIGVQVSGAAAGERIRVAAGYARSRFTNPLRDRELVGDSSIVPVTATARNARYAELSVGIVQGKTLPLVGPASLVTGYRHERIDPLYRTTAASLQADQQQHAFDVTGSLGIVSLQLTRVQSRDNLADVPSVLRTGTRPSTLAGGIVLPTATRFGRIARYLPTLSVNLTRAHQLAFAAPTNGDFRAQDLPDQARARQDSHTRS